MDDVISAIPPVLLRIRKGLVKNETEDALKYTEKLRTLLTIAGQTQFLDECDELAKALKRGNTAIAEDLLTKLQKKITGFEEKAIIEIKAQEPKTRIFVKILPCPYCGRGNTEEAKFCSDCGEKIKPNKRCPGCNEETYETSNFCRHCGYQLKQAA